MAKARPIELDLRRDLPKVREQLADVMRGRGKCLYAAPCVIGAMVPPRRRAPLDKSGDYDSSVSTWVRRGRISMPKGQVKDAQALQSAFDTKPEAEFFDTLAELEAKYLAEQAV